MCFSVWLKKKLFNFRENESHQNWGDRVVNRQSVARFFVPKLFQRRNNWPRQTGNLIFFNLSLFLYNAFLHLTFIQRIQQLKCDLIKCGLDNKGNDHAVKFHEIKIQLFQEVKFLIMRSKFNSFMRLNLSNNIDQEVDTSVMRSKLPNNAF